MEPTDDPSINKEQRLWATIAHLSAFSLYLTAVGFLLGPLIVWLAKRDGNPFVEEHAREALNFQITIAIYAAISGVLCFLLIGIPMLIALHIFQIVCMIVAAIKANDGLPYRYPLTLRLISAP